MPVKWSARSSDAYSRMRDPATLNEAQLRNPQNRESSSSMIRGASDQSHSPTFAPYNNLQSREVVDTRLPESVSRFSLDFEDYETVLKGTEVYGRTSPSRDIDKSLAPSSRRGSGWSMLSQFSLNDISKISVYRLPIRSETISSNLSYGRFMQTYQSSSVVSQLPALQGVQVEISEPGWIARSTESDVNPTAENTAAAIQPVLIQQPQVFQQFQNRGETRGLLGRRKQRLKHSRRSDFTITLLQERQVAPPYLNITACPKYAAQRTANTFLKKIS